jgi:hypothetical protein
MNRPQDEQRLDDLVRDLARDYNAPGAELDEDRRAELFARIRQERRHRARHRAPAPRARHWQWAAAMVAVLLIGIAIGRWQPAPIQHETPEQVVATQPEPAPAGQNLYQYAARDFLERTDNLLVMLQRAAYSPDPDTPFGDANSDPTIGWAQALLRETRLLQDSPATQGDPQLTQLLEDLELLLAQIVQATRGNQELEGNTVTDPAVLQRVRGEIQRSVAKNEI